jgi:hypothetical protein
VRAPPGRKIYLLTTVLLSEPITLNLLVGLIAVFAGIWIATTVPGPGPFLAHGPGLSLTRGGATTMHGIDDGKCG